MVMAMVMIMVVVAVVMMVVVMMEDDDDEVQASFVKEGLVCVVCGVSGV